MYCILKDGRLQESETPGQYAGHRHYKIFGTLDCAGGKQMKKGNRVFFADLEHAVMAGYRPCKNCEPVDETEFERIKHLVPFDSLQEFYNSGRQFK